MQPHTTTGLARHLVGKVDTKHQPLRAQNLPTILYQINSHDLLLTDLEIRF